MKSSYKVAVIVGSIRKDSINRKLAMALMKLARKDMACEVVKMDDLPLYNQDMDQSPSDSVLRFKTQIAAADALLFVTPEHNRSIPAALKNALDWASRPYGKNLWARKPCGITGASIGAVGTAVAQQHLRNILAYLDVPALGQPEVFIHFTDGIVDANGDIANAGTRTFLKGFMDRHALWVDTILH